jgi:hypothetical protein
MPVEAVHWRISRHAGCLFLTPCEGYVCIPAWLFLLLLPWVFWSCNTSTAHLQRSFYQRSLMLLELWVKALGPMHSLLICCDHAHAVARAGVLCTHFECSPAFEKF